MDYYNHLQRDNFYKDDVSRNNYNGAEDKKVEQFTIQQIELYIQQQVAFSFFKILYFSWGRRKGNLYNRSFLILKNSI